MGTTTTTVERAALPRATVGETIGLLADVFLPNVAKGVIIRRPPVVAMAERLGLDRRAVRRMQRLRDKYGQGPLMLRLPFRSQAVILAPEHVHRVLDQSPEPFSRRRGAADDARPAPRRRELVGAQAAPRRSAPAVLRPPEQPPGPR